MHMRDVIELFERLERAGLRMWWVAEKIGVHDTTLRGWKNGKIKMSAKRKQQLSDFISKYEEKK